MNVHGIANHDYAGNLLPLCILGDPNAPDVFECPHCSRRRTEQVKREVESMEWPDEIEL